MYVSVFGQGVEVCILLFRNLPFVLIIFFAILVSAGVVVRVASGGKIYHLPVIELEPLERGVGGCRIGFVSLRYVSSVAIVFGRANIDGRNWALTLIPNHLIFLSPGSSLSHSRNASTP